MKFFFDNNLSPRLARALGWLLDDVEIAHLRDLYAAEKGGATPDLVWIRDCAKAGWVVITCDAAIGSKPTERAELKKTGLVIFFLTKGIQHQSPAQQMIHLLQHWPEISAAASTARPGMRWFKVRAQGKLEVIPE